MEKTTKFILKLLNFGILFMLFSCENDLYEDKIYQSKINVEKISLKESKSNTKINTNLFKAVSKINSKNNITTGRIVYDSINNIYFDDENGIKISQDDYESYTFKIIKENGKLENLLFTKNQYNEFDAFKVKYDFTEEEMKYLNAQDTKPKEIISLSDPTNANRMMYVTFLVSACSTWPWDCGGSICGFIEVTFSMWIDDAIGDGGSSGGGGSTSGDGSSDGNGLSGGSIGSGSGIITIPNVADNGDNITAETPCERLIRISNDAVFKSNFNTLNSPARFSMDKETGFAESRNANGNKIYMPTIALDGQHAIDIPLSFNATSSMHDHTNFGGLDIEGNELVSIKIFSPKDIKTLMGQCQTNATNLNVPLNDIYSIVLSSEGIFAMNLLSPPVSNTLTYADWKLFRDKYERANQEFANNGNLNNAHVKRKLLQLLKEFHLDDKVALFEANFIASDPTTPKWSRLTLNPLNSDVVVPTPCK